MTIAVVTNECQKGVIGEYALWQALADAAKPAIANMARVVDAARAAGVPVVHCVAVRRPDLLGASENAPLFAVANRARGLLADTPPSELIDELGPDELDLVHPKTHGVASLRTTGVDAALRNLGVQEVVLVGVSVNVAIQALAFEGVNLGYDVTVVRDAVAGVPPEYAESVISNTLAYVAEIITTDELIRRLPR